MKAIALHPGFRTLPEPIQQRIAAGRCDFIALTLLFTIGANGSDTRNITAPTDEDYILVAGTRTGTTQADKTADVAFLPYTVRLEWGSAGADLTPTPAHLESLFGNAKQPAEYAIPLLITGGRSLAVTLQNLGAGAHEIRVTFHALRVYRR